MTKEAEGIETSTNPPDASEVIRRMTGTSRDQPKAPPLIYPACQDARAFRTREDFRDHLPCEDCQPSQNSPLSSEAPLCEPTGPSDEPSMGLPGIPQKATPKSEGLGPDSLMLAQTGRASSLHPNPSNYVRYPDGTYGPRTQDYTTRQGNSMQSLDEPAEVWTAPAPAEATEVILTIDGGKGGEGFKADAGKDPWELVCWPAIVGIVKVLKYGLNKYAAKGSGRKPDNWRYVENGRDRYFAAAIRHIVAWRQGEKNDQESGLPHLWHVLCNLMFLTELDEK